MKNLLFITMLLGVSWGEIVVTEFFTKAAEETNAPPQYIELYNTSNTEIVDLEGWSVNTFFTYDGGVLATTNPSFPTDFLFNNSFVTINDVNNDGSANDLLIYPNNYFVISSNYYSGDIFLNDQTSNIEITYTFTIGESATYPNGMQIGGKVCLQTNQNTGECLYEIDITGGKTILLDNDENEVDKVEFNIDDWPLGAESHGHSLRLHVMPDSNDNDDSANWSISPTTDKSNWLYGVDSENYGSPREENSFRINHNIIYSDVWFPDTFYVNGDTHNIYGDYNNYYRAEPYLDSNANGIWDTDEEFNDRNLNNLWDYQNNNFNDSLGFSWDNLLIDLENYEYEIIFEKKNISIDSISFWISGGTSSLNITDTTIRISNSKDTTILLSPSELLVDLKGRYREISEYTWTIELIKTFPDYVDTIYSDINTLIIDASDYGRYGCVDDGCCTDDPNAVDESDGCPILCPTNAYYEDLYNSNHPDGCTPGFDCYTAINYYSDLLLYCLSLNLQKIQEKYNQDLMQLD